MKKRMAWIAAAALPLAACGTPQENVQINEAALDDPTAADNGLATDANLTDDVSGAGTLGNDGALNAGELGNAR